jgi:hypothetical protein
MRLSPDGGKTQSDRFSHWRVLWCPDGAGNVLFGDSTLFGGQTRVYADNPAVARWLQKNIETFLYPKFADANLPIVQAQFTRAGAPPNPGTETIVGGGDLIVMTWSDTIAPFVVHAPPGFNNRPIGVFTTLFPARAARVELNGKVPDGKAWPEMREDRQSSSACLAWSEIWVKPRS